MAHHEIEQLEDLESRWRPQRANVVRFAYLQAGRMLAASFHEPVAEEAERYRSLAEWFAREAFAFECETNERMRYEYDSTLSDAVGDPPKTSTMRQRLLDDYGRLPESMRARLQSIAEEWERER
jgi:hypothetical protein